jgi:flagellar motor switch protein FliN/FliY
MADEILALSRRTPNRTGYGDSNGGMNVNVSPSNFGNQSAGIGMVNSGPQIGIKGVSFPSLSTAGAPSGATNLNLLMDVQMSLTVELGRTKMYIKDILGLGEGSIIELDKLAGEPVDLLVNGKLIAKGEVVVIDENFGVRVTDIVSPTDRIKNESK